MRRSLTLHGALLLTALTTHQAGSPQSPGTIRIVNFKSDRTAAVSMTLDGALRNPDEFAVPLLNRCGIKAT